MWGKAMARHPSNKLTALAVKKQTTPGRYSDGNGLYLVVDPSGAKRWLQRLSILGKRCDLGLGSTRLVSLDDAREQALINRRAACYPSACRRSLSAFLRCKAAFILSSCIGCVPQALWWLHHEI